MNFKTTLSKINKKDFAKSWVSLYQSGLLQFKGVKREATDIGFIRPITSYLVAFIGGYFILNWGLQGISDALSGIEICFGALVLFVIAINIAYAIRPKWFSYLAEARLLPKESTDITLDDTTVTFKKEGATESTTWKWNDITKVLRFVNTLILYTGDATGYLDSKTKVLVINRADLSEEDWNTLDNTYIEPLKVKNTYKGYYSYSDIVIFLLFCLFVALMALPYYPV